MRMAILMNLAPRKLGSFEGWIASMCEDSRSRGQAVDVYARAPVHPQWLERMRKLGVGVYDVGELERGPVVRAIRRLAGYDVLHLNMFVPRSRMALLAYAAVPAKVMFVDHTSGPVPGKGKPGSSLVALLRRVADVVTVARVEGIAGVSEYVSERNRKRFPLKASRVRTIYNGVDMRRFIPKDEFFDLTPPVRKAPDPDAPVMVLTTAHLIPQKGVDYLVRGLAQARDRRLRLTVVGDGPEAGRLQALAQELGLGERVRFVGLRDDVHALLCEADIFVHPAVWEEAFGLTITEAMSSALAVVATCIGGIPELIEHERSGLLVEPKSPEAIARALDLLAADPGLRAQLGANARARVQERFALDRCARAHVEWCESVVPPARRHPAGGKRSGAQPRTEAEPR